MAVRENFYGPGPLGAAVDVVIPPDGTAAAADVLQRAGVVKYAWMFRLAAAATRHRGKIHAGEFLIPAHASLAEIFNVLRHGAQVQHQVTIPEGLTGAQIAAILNAAKDAAGHVDPPRDGAVLPQTYDFTLGTDRAVILSRAEASMQHVLDAEWAARDVAVPLNSPQDALTLASIVQQETPVAAELPEVAAVYENRLAKGMKLQADPTVIFAASGGRISGGVGITRDDLAAPSPYNTYLFEGLPPGPICAPGLAAIQAVLHPAASQALYFVASGLGGSVFTDEYKQHLRNVDAYRAHRN